MATPYIEELALISKNNEAIDEIIYLREENEAGVSVPMDLTGRTFFAQARLAKLTDAELICAISATVYGDPTLGQLRLSVTEAVMGTIDPIKGHYDVLTKVAGGPTDNIYMAPFIVEGGVSKWLP